MDSVDGRGVWNVDAVRLSPVAHKLDNAVMLQPFERSEGRAMAYVCSQAQFMRGEVERVVCGLSGSRERDADAERVFVARKACEPVGVR